MSNFVDKVKDSSKDALSKTKSALGIQKEPTVVDEISDSCPQLSYQQVCIILRIFCLG